MLRNPQELVCLPVGLKQPSRKEKEMGVSEGRGTRGQGKFSLCCLLSQELFPRAVVAEGEERKEGFGWVCKPF